ncbi:MAG TPA: ABC transporter permease [Pyrinomonadaceae bacterium]|nr:ABC transporter permease [Pyrinomonadaceae bacterium]
MNTGLLKPAKHSNRALRLGVAVLIALYLVAIFADFIAPYDYREQTRQEPSAPATTLRFRDEAGTLHVRPFIYKQKLADARNQLYEDDTSHIYPLAFFVHGHSYRLLGLMSTNIHLFGVLTEAAGSEDRPRIRLLGTDQLGRDRFSRLLYAIRFSLLVSPIGTILACLIGIVFGALSGYAGRTVDAIMMGIADTMISLPALILILAARAAFPLELPLFTAAALLIGIFALTGWAEMARLTRGLVRSVRGREYILAARSIGLTETRILWRHIMPNISRPLLVQATLLLPAFLLAEVALSFLGVGVQDPEPSLGNMLSSAADMSLLRSSPFIMLSPALAIFLFVFAVRLIGWRRSGHP